MGRVNLNPGDERYDAPPGVASATVTTAKRRGKIPVRFEPPDAPVALAGYTLARGFSGTQVGATLTQMAVNGAIQLQAKPLGFTQVDPSKLQTHLEAELYEHANEPGKRLGTSSRRRVVRDVEWDLAMTERDPRLFLEKGANAKTQFFRVGVVAVMALGVYLGYRSIGLEILKYGFFPILVFIGFLWGTNRQMWRLGAEGTRIREQALGFREYIRKAEADQIRFEADQDIYRRYLPWAVLFGEVKRWTKVCEELAAAGRISTPDMSFMSGASSMSSVSKGLSSMSSSLGGSSSWSGSGSSSGSSGGGSSGGGGGGSSASSW